VQLPADALQAYESLRNAVRQGLPCAPGLAALRFHGMWNGLAVMASAAAPPPAAKGASYLRASAIASDDQFVRLLANLVLRTHVKLTHVY
jgi:hypothetical protein